MTREERCALWRKLVEQQAESGMNAAAFCRENQINLHRFYTWRRRFRNQLSRQTNEGGFFQLVPYRNQTPGPIRIRLKNAVLIEVERGFDPTTLREVIETVQG